MYLQENSQILACHLDLNKVIHILGSETQITINAAFRVGKSSDYVPEAKTDNSRISQLEKLVQSLTEEVATLKNGN